MARGSQYGNFKLLKSDIAHPLQRITVRNLRIREDTAKYLRNLDTESAHYDPKSRSMRQAPNATDNPEDAAYAGDNFQRMGGLATEHQNMQLFAWQAEQRGQNVHLQTGPTQASLVHKQYETKKGDLKEKSGQSMLDKYGGAEYLQKPPKELLQGQTDNYVEYDRSTGQLIKGLERAKARSKYEEDGQSRTRPFCECVVARPLLTPSESNSLSWQSHLGVGLLVERWHMGLCLLSQ